MDIQRHAEYPLYTNYPRESEGSTSQPTATSCLLTGARVDSRHAHLHKVEISQLYANLEAEAGSAAAGSAPQAIPACFAQRIARVP